MTRYKGIPASGGIAIGKAFLFRSELPALEERTVESVEAELARLDAAIATVSRRLKDLAKGLSGNTQGESAEILGMQHEFLDDPALIDEARTLIHGHSLNAEAAVFRASKSLIEEFATVQEEYFKQRGDDIRDVSFQLIRALLGLPEVSLADVPPGSIIIARNLNPSDTATMNVKNTLAFCTETGSATSHTAIISRSLGIPSVVGLGDIPVDAGARLIVDGEEGIVIADPDDQTLSDYQRRMESWKIRWKSALSRASEPVYAEDGHRVEVVANVGSLPEARGAVELGAEGIGLLRTEFLFLKRQTLPDEEEQRDIYRRIFELFPKGPLVVRTLDVGGDKQIPSIKRLPEENPFLGRRGIRLSLSEKEMFRTQLRALLQAAAGFDVRIMFPMVATVDEIRQGKEQLDIALKELENAGKKQNRACEIGVMIEVPSAAIAASHLAAEVDFFSIGTNDLTQYTLAMDRTDRYVSEQADPYDPAVLFLIDRTVRAAHAAGKWVGMCGELAGDPLALPFLLGVRLDELSMASARIPEVKQGIRDLAGARLQEVAARCLELPSGHAVRTYLSDFAEKAGVQHNGTG